MSRIQYNEDFYDEPYWQLSQGRWDHNLKVTLTSKRGQQALRDLEAALLAIPEKRLITGDFCVPIELGDGPTVVVGYEVCALGALALARNRLPQTIDDLLDLNDDLTTADAIATWATDNLNLSYTLAWQIVWANDELYPANTPEERYATVLRWIQDALDGSHQSAPSCGWP